jgi:VanZ family protein
MAGALSLVLIAPYIGDIRDALRSAWPGRYGLLINAIVGGLVLAALVAAALRIRAARPARFGAIGLAIALAAVSAMLTASASASQNAVERFHFVEYGLITFLFYRVALPSRDGQAADLSLLILPTLAALLVSTADEWLQWFIPGRVGEWRDVFLNGTAIAVGLLFSLGAEPPAAWRPALPIASRRRVAIAAAAVVLALTAFVHAVHIGVLVTDRDAGAFRSRYDAETLRALSADRAAAWATRPPTAPARLSREDKYLAEAVWHIRARNEAWDAGRHADAWFENRILETFFAPVLDADTYAAPAARWPAAQRDDAARRGAAATPAAYLSRAEPAPLLLWSTEVVWTVGLVTTTILLVIALVPRPDSW